MINLRCKCGDSLWSGSWHPAPCQGCDKCGTTFAGRPSDHEMLKPHDPVPRYSSETGALKGYRCKVCHDSCDEHGAAV